MIKLDEQLIEKCESTFTLSHIKRMKAYLTLEIQKVEEELNKTIIPDDMIYLVYSLIKLNTTLAYFDKSNRDEILNKIIPELEEKHKNITNLAMSISAITNNVLSEEDNTKCQNESESDYSFCGDPLQYSTPSIANDENTKLSKYSDYDTDAIDDFECDYTQPLVRSVNDENMYNKKFNTTTNLVSTFCTQNNDNISISSDMKVLNETVTPNLKLNTDADKKNLETYNFVNNPDHYMHYDMSTYDMMVKIWGKYETMIWCKLTAWKYRQRMGTKPGECVQRDLDKEKWYLEKYHLLKEELGK